MEKRLIVAIALSMLIIVMFQYLAPKPSRVQEPIRVAEPVKLVTPAQVPGEAVYSQPKPSIEEKELVVETDRLVLTFSNVGGALKKVQLKGSSDVVQIDNPKEYIFNISGSLDGAELATSVYSAQKRDGEVSYSLATKDVEVIKRYILHNYKHSIELQLFVKNLSSSPKELNYRVVGGAGLTESNNQDKRFLEVTSKINGKALKFKRPKTGRIMNPGAVSWTALKSKYLSIILKPFVNTKGQFYYEDKNGNLVMGLEPENIMVSPGASIENKFVLYVGPSQPHLLKEVGYDLEETINYGFFGGISKLLISSMRFLHKIVRNWGISIILLSIFLNIILFPLTIKSFKSMQKMQELHPQMEKLKTQYKDNPKKLNKEIMELYKKYNINPLSGCLPLVLQMPIFISLYQALMKSFELRNAPFLWIKDLSLPDAVPIPFVLPVIGKSVNILPLIMVIAMVIQQKISTQTMGAAVTEEQKQQQKIMLIIMPIMFGFIFYNMPSGLVLYWVVNTVLTIVEQSAILKKT